MVAAGLRKALQPPDQKVKGSTPSGRAIFFKDLAPFVPHAIAVLTTR
jgi:hypothetical protein